jgi:hypothetical protein
MIRGCTVCKKNIEVPTLQTKYCSDCAKIMYRKRARDWKRNHITRKEFDLFCLDCNVSLPLNSKGDKKYCSLCARKRTKQSRKVCYLSKKRRDKLDKFYKNLRINFIESPYFAERKSLNSIVLLENK